MPRHLHQMPFAEGSEFVWTRPGISNGVPVEAGSPVDKSIFTPTRLRQLYEARRIQPAPFGEAKPHRYLNNGIGKAAKLAAELAAEEGQGDAVSNTPAPAAPRSGNAKKSAPAAKSAGAKSAAKPAAKPTRAKRAA